MTTSVSLAAFEARRTPVFKSIFLDESCETQMTILLTLSTSDDEFRLNREAYEAVIANLRAVANRPWPVAL